MNVDDGLEDIRWILGLGGEKLPAASNALLPNLKKGLFFAGRCSVTICLTDLDGTVTQHDCNLLAVDGFPFFDGKFLAVDGKSNLTIFLRR